LSRSRFGSFNFSTALFYYMQQGQITRWSPVFENEIQVLMVFAIVWIVLLSQYRHTSIVFAPLHVESRRGRGTHQVDESDAGSGSCRAGSGDGVDPH
jgi:hypothetical protein